MTFGSDIIKACNFQKKFDRNTCQVSMACLSKVSLKPPLYKLHLSYTYIRKKIFGSLSFLLFLPCSQANSCAQIGMVKAHQFLHPEANRGEALLALCITLFNSSSPAPMYPVQLGRLGRFALTPKESSNSSLGFFSKKIYYPAAVLSPLPM